jgi:uncharacterized membrane protein YGL010W
MKEMLFRFLVGGIAVSTFSALGDVLTPKSFAGLFGAAPSVALATLALTIAKEGVNYTAVEARSMLAGAVVLGIYSYSVMKLMAHRKRSALFVSLSLLSVWFVVAFGLYVVVFR